MEADRKHYKKIMMKKAVQWPKTKKIGHSKCSRYKNKEELEKRQNKCVNQQEERKAGKAHIGKSNLYIIIYINIYIYS